MSPPAPRQQLYQLLAGKWVAAAIAAAAEIGLADRLAGRALDLAALAEELGCDTDRLGRLLRVLGGEGLVTMDRQSRYALTPLGEELQEGRSRELARFIGMPLMWSPWARLAEGLASSTSAFEAAMGAPLFEYLDRHPRESELYHRAVDAFTRAEARALASAFDFREVRTVVDVGGGLGTLIAELTDRWPGIAQCVLFDRAGVIEQVRGSVVGRTLGSRLQLVAGDFLDAIPVAADVYVLKHVLHNWDDRAAVRILRNCEQQLRPAGHVLIVEGVLLPGLQRDQTAYLDLEMFVLCGGGRERSKPEFRRLLHAAGLKLRSTHDLDGTTRLLVAERR